MCNESFNEDKSKVELNFLFLLKFAIKRVSIANLLSLFSLKQILEIKRENCVENCVKNHENSNKHQVENYIGLK